MKIKKGGLLTAAAHKAGVAGNIGLRQITRAVCSVLHCSVPQTKSGCWKLLQGFVGVASPVVNVPTFHKKRTRETPAVMTDAFLLSYEWRRLRMTVLKKYGSRCQCCGATPADGKRMNVDHIKPRRKYPELALTESNLQVLCEDCNHGKGNWDETDWRQSAEPLTVTAEDIRALLH